MIEKGEDVNSTEKGSLYFIYCGITRVFFKRKY